MCISTIIYENEELKISDKSIIFEGTILPYHILRTELSDITYAYYYVFDTEEINNNAKSLILEFLNDYNSFICFQYKLLEKSFFETIQDIRYSIYLVFIAEEPDISKMDKRIITNFEFAKKIIFNKEDAIFFFNKKKFFSQNYSKNLSLKNQYLRILKDIDSYNYQFPLMSDYSNEFLQNGIKFSDSLPNTFNKQKTNRINEFNLIDKINEIQITDFRQFNGELNIPLRKVNVFFGDNGAGKTSILEAIEYGLTNTTQNSINNLDSESGNVRLACTTKNGKNRIFSSGDNINIYKEYLNIWYGIEDESLEALNSAFCKFNYFDIRGAYRFAFDDFKNKFDNFNECTTYNSKIYNFSEYLLSQQDLRLSTSLDKYRYRINYLKTRAEKTCEELERTFQSKKNNIGILEKFFKRSKKYIPTNMELFLFMSYYDRDILKKLCRKLEPSDLYKFHKHISKKRYQLEDLASKLNSIPSTEEFTQNVIEENIDNINKFYKLLCLSRNYNELILEDKKTISAKSYNDDLISLQQISTGQKVCVALSIMFAMFFNSKTVPNVIFLDEPVANLDTFHLLNLIDIIRDFAIIKNVQIVFTTANVKTAQLLRRKFSFLKDDFGYYEIIDSTDKIVVTLKDYDPDKEEAAHKLDFISKRKSPEGI